LQKNEENNLNLENKIKTKQTLNTENELAKNETKSQFNLSKKTFIDAYNKSDSNNQIASTKDKQIKANKNNTILELKIINSHSKDLNGTSILINYQGLVDKNKRNKNDGITYFGYQPHTSNTNENKEQFVDFNLPIKDKDNYEKIGRYFQINFNSDINKYFIRDLLIGFGTFVRIDFPLKLRDNHLINIGETFIIINLILKKTEEIKEMYNDNIDNICQIRLKFFYNNDLNNGGDTFYFPYSKKEISIGRLNFCDIQIQDNLLSKLHCRIWSSKEKEWFISDGNKDDASTNGTWLYLNEDFDIYDQMIFKSNQTLFQCFLTENSE